MVRIVLTPALVCVLACFASSQSPPQDDDSLRNAILPLVTTHSGDVAVAIKHLKSNESFHYRSDQPMPTASLIKLPLMITVYDSASRRELDLGQPIMLKDEDKVPGSGILTDHISSGVKLTLRDYVRLMIRYSDNTATNIVIEQVGLRNTAQLMESLSLNNTKLHSKVYRGDTSIFPDRSKRFGLGSTTADEMVTLLSKLYAQELADDVNTGLMLEHLLSCDDRSKLARYLPAETKFFHKSGAIGNCRTDAGIMETAAGPVAVCVLTNKNSDQSWGDENEAELLCAKIGQAIIDRFEHPAQPQSVRRGSTGRLVESLQRTLNARLDPSPNLGIDGDFGPATEKAVQLFQQASGIQPSAVLDPTTWNKLGTLIDEEVLVEEPEQFNARVEKLAKRPPLTHSEPPIVTCKAWVVTDAVTGNQLSGYNASERRAPASTTKIMTAHLVVQMIAEDPALADEVVTISQNADNTAGSSCGLRAGEQVTVLELLYGLMLPSGNDAAIAMAEHFGDRLQQELPDKEDDPVKAFVACMNRTAKTLGMNATKFKNPHGLSDPDHLTTAADLARLTFVALQDGLFKRLVSTRQFACVVDSHQGYRRTVIWRNTNQLLEIEGYDGVKTGTTDAAGACLVASGTQTGKSRTIVILGSSESQARYADLQNLFRWSLLNSP